MNTQESKDLQLVAIRRLAKKSRKKSFGNKDISNELARIPSLSDDEAKAIIHSAGFRRTELKEEGLLKRTAKPGRARGNLWSLTSSGRERASEIIKEKPEWNVAGEKQNVETLAKTVGVDAQAIQLLKNSKVPTAELDKLLQQWLDNQNKLPAPLLSEEEVQNAKSNLAVERKAIKFIQAKEPNPRWHIADELGPGKQPGFDLYQTANNLKTGKMTLWCEVKSFSGAFRSALLTPTEFETARKYRTKYWLYIVENVASGSPNLFRIQDPASKVSGLHIDASWKRFATE